MAIFFDIVLLAIFVITVIRHFSLGLACSVLNAGRLLFSLLVAAILCYPIGAVFYSLGVPSAFSGVIAFIVIFVVTLILSKLLIKLLSKIKIPVITKVDKFLGLLLGIVLGAIFVSFLSTAVYTVIELISSVNAESEIMSVYEDSFVFKFIYDLKLFDFIRNLF